MTKTKEDRLNRVKVYSLTEAWIDKGTGYCFGEVEDGAPFLVVRNELDDQEQLLKAKIEGSVQFQRQQDTLIVWTDSEGQSIALSFQEKEGCSSMCDFIIHVHESKRAPLISLVSVISNDMEGDVTELIVGPITYPPVSPTADDLQQILTCFNGHTNSHYYRQSIFKFIEQNEYITKLISLFDECEKKRQIKYLHILCFIIKALIAHDEGYVIRLMEEDTLMIGIAGILEYDPDYPRYKANHRKMLQDESNFKELLPVKDDEFTGLIKKTFRLQFLKDVVLVRLLEDPTYNQLNTHICMNQGSIIRFLEASDFLDELFRMYTRTAETSKEREILTLQKREGIKLLHQFVLTAKNSSATLKTKFFKTLIKKGLLKSIEFVLTDDFSDTRVLALELIVSIIGHDMMLISSSLDEEPKAPTKTNNEDKRSTNGNLIDDSPFDGEDYEKDDEDISILDTNNQVSLSDDMTILLILTRFLLEGNEFGLRIQAYEALKALLDPINNVNSPRFMNDEAKAERLNTTVYFSAFYEQVAPTLFAPMIDLGESDAADRQKDDLFICLCELVSFCSSDRGASRSFFMENSILRGVSLLIRPCHKLQLRLAAIRSLKALVQLNDEYYTRTIIAGDLFKEVFALLDSLNGTPELSYSTVLDLLEIILVGIEKGDNRKNFRLLANYIVMNYRSSLESIRDVNSGKDLIKCIEVDTTTTNGGDDDDDDADSNDDYSEDILTEPLHEEDSLIQHELLKENSMVLGTPEKRLREVDEGDVSDSDSVQQKKKSTLKQKFANAGKKFASKFGSSR